MSMQSDTFILSKKGWLITVFVATLFLFFTMTELHLFQFMTGALLLVLLIIFRNPERNTTINETFCVVSCCDGIVLGIEDTIIHEHAMKKITILNSLWDVSMLRAPFDSAVEGYQIRHGVSLALNNPLAEELNEKCVIHFRSLRGDDVYIEHMNEQSYFDLMIDLEEGDRLKEGTRYGFLAKGKTVVYLPAHADVLLHHGSDLKAGESVIARLERSSVS